MKAETIVEDIYALFDPSKSHHVNEDNLHEFGEIVKNVVRQGLLERDTAKDPLRFSALGKPDRQIWYAAKGYEPEKMSSKTYLKFLYGHVIEAMLLFLVKESGHEVKDEQAEVNVDGVLGHIDCTIDGVVCDVKSAAPYSYEKFLSGAFYEDVFSKQYLDQLCGYSNVLTPGKSPMFLVFDKVAGSVATVPIAASIAEQYDPVERISHLKEVIKQDEPPPRCYDDEPDGASGNRKLSLGCSYCSHKFRCWDGLRAFAYSGKPKFLTKVVKEPNVPEFFPNEG